MSSIDIHDAVWSHAQVCCIIRNMNIMNIRKRRGLNQEELAELAHTSQSTISRAEKGDDSVTMAMLKDIAAALDVPLRDLFDDDRSTVEAEVLEMFRRAAPSYQTGLIDALRLARQDQAQSK